MSLRTSLLLALPGLPGVALGAPGSADRHQVEAIVREFEQLPGVDLGYCAHEFADFKARHEALIVSPPAQAMDRAREAFGLKSNPPTEVDHEPSRQRCLEVLNKATDVYARHDTYLRKLADRLPPVDD